MLLVDVSKGSDGRWRIVVNDTHRERIYPLVPGGLLIRLWRAPETGILRGTVQLRGTEYEAPIHTNDRLEAMVRDWLAGGSDLAGRQ